MQQHKVLSEHHARWLFQQLILAVEYCHKMNICNRDIKLDNILLDKSTRGRPDWPIMKICDWGYARSGVTSEACSKVGTLSYMAPEVLQNNTYSTKKADVWSCGVVLYAMLVSQTTHSAHRHRLLGVFALHRLSKSNSARGTSCSFTQLTHSSDECCAQAAADVLVALAAAAAPVVLYSCCSAAACPLQCCSRSRWGSASSALLVTCCSAASRCQTSCLLAHRTC